MTTAEAINETLQSTNVADSNLESVNIVDVINKLAIYVKWVSLAILPNATMPVKDETGGSVASLTEAVMGVTAGLCRIADAINGLAEAVRERG